MPRVLVIADDLSGAADCGVAFTRSGLSVVVAMGSGCVTTADVLCVDANSRSLAPSDAREAIDQLMREYSPDRSRIVYKKLDSTLRGNVGAELAGMLWARRRRFSGSLVIMAPAFPANGRTTINGRQLLHGKPLEDTELWRSQKIAGSSFIPSMIEPTGMTSGVLTHETVRDAELFPSAFGFMANSADVVICDAESDQDLATIAVAAAKLGPGPVWAGSAGLAYHLASAFLLAPSATNVVRAPVTLGATLFVVGSPAATSREQARVLAQSENLCSITMSPQELNSVESRELNQRRISAALSAGHDVLVTLVGEGLKFPGVSLTRHLAATLSSSADCAGALVVTGGETARAILQQWGVNALRILREVEPGIPLCVTENWTRPIPVITKAGDFGDPQTLLHCRGVLAALPRKEQ